MNTISEIKSWPNESTVESIQGKIARTYEYRTVGTANGSKTVQNAELEDASGNKVRISVWEHPDLKTIEGKEVVLHSNKSGNGRFGGVSVKIGTYKDKPTFELSVSKLGTFQLLEVYKANSGSAGTQVSPDPSNALKTQGKGVSEDSGKSSNSINGASIGVAIKEACANLTQSGQELTEAAIWKLASRVVRVAQKMEAGELANE